jgi:hypothetical protein
MKIIDTKDKLVNELRTITYETKQLGSNVFHKLK